MGGGGASVFSRDNIDLVATSVSILGCIVFTLLMEIALNRLEHIAKSDEAKNAFVHKMYEEMITLGFFSFGLILLIDFQVFEGKAKKAGLLKFEFAHLWLFMFGMFMVLQNLVGFMVIHSIEKKWIKADHLGVQNVLEIVAPEFLAGKNIEVTAVKKPYKARNGCIRSIFGGGETYDFMEYEAMKNIFLTQNANISSADDFRFAKYLQRATSQSISEHLEDISYTKWLILIIIGVGYIALIHYWNKNTPVNNEDLWFSLGFSVFLGILSIILMLVSRGAKKELIRVKAFAEYGQQKADPCPPEKYPKLMEKIWEDREKEKRKKKEAGEHVTEKKHCEHPVEHRHESKIKEKEKEAKRSHVADDLNQSRKEIYRKDCWGKEHLKDQEDHLIANGEGLFPCKCLKLKTSHMLWANDMVTLLQCFYLGLFVTLIASLAVKDFESTALKVSYILLILSEQLLVMLWTGPSLVKDVVLIQSMLHAKEAIVEEVLDEVKELEEIRDKISAAIQEEFKDSYNRALELRNCYRELDADGSGTLGSKELKSMLADKVKIKFHGRQCDLIIQEMDKDLSGEVDFREFYEYVFPDEDITNVELD